MNTRPNTHILSYSSILYLLSNSKDFGPHVRISRRPSHNQTAFDDNRCLQLSTRTGNLQEYSHGGVFFKKLQARTVKGVFPGVG